MTFAGTLLGLLVALSFVSRRVEPTYQVPAQQTGTERGDSPGLTRAALSREAIKVPREQDGTGTSRLGMEHSSLVRLSRSVFFAPQNLGFRRQNLSALLRLQSVSVAEALLSPRWGEPPRAFDVNAEGTLFAAVYGHGHVGVWGTRDGEMVYDVVREFAPELRRPAEAVHLIDEENVIVIVTTHPSQSLILDARPKTIPTIARLWTSLVAHWPEHDGHVFVGVRSDEVSVWSLGYDGLDTDGSRTFVKRATLTMPGAVRMPSEEAVRPVDGRIALVLDKSMVAVVHPGDARIDRVFHLDDVVASAVLSMDGSALYVTGYDDQVRALDVESGNVLWSSGVGPPHWNWSWFEMPLLLSSDGRLLVASLRRAEVVVLETRTGALRARFALERDGGSIKKLAWLDDEQWLVVLTDEVHLLSMGSTRQRGSGQ